MEKDIFWMERISVLNKVRDKVLKNYEDSFNYDDIYNPPKEVDELGNEIREIIITEQDFLPVDFIIESLTKLGESPSILYDDNGHFSVVSEGFQSVPMDDDGEMIDDLYPNGDVSMSFYVEKKKWFGTIREALSYYLKYDEK